MRRSSRPKWMHCTSRHLVLPSMELTDDRFGSVSSRWRHIKKNNGSRIAMPRCSQQFTHPLEKLNGSPRFMWVVNLVLKKTEFREKNGKITSMKYGKAAGPDRVVTDVIREFRHREVSLPPRHFGFRTSGAPSQWRGGSSERLQ